MNPLSKEQLKEYYQKRKQELNQKRTENRKLARLRQKDESEVETAESTQWVETIERVETPSKVKTGLRQIEAEIPQKEIRLGQVNNLKVEAEQVETSGNKTINESCSRCPKLEKRTKELELKIISLQETNQILKKDLDYWQEADLENKYKENIKDLTNKINQLEQKCRELERTTKNQQPKEVIKEINQSCKLEHYSLSELFKQAKDQVKQAHQEIKSQGGIRQCWNCDNSQRNHQLAINLLEKYWEKTEKLEKRSRNKSQTLQN